MPILTALSLTGTALGTLGQLRGQQNQIDLAGFHRQEVRNQAQASANIFSIRLPRLLQQQSAQRGAQATRIAKGGVDVGKGSALTFLSEQARLDSVNVSLQKFQQQLEQASFANEQKLTKRGIKQIRTNQAFTLASGLVSGATTLARR